MSWAWHGVMLWLHDVMVQIAGNVCHRLVMLKQFGFLWFLQSFMWTNAISYQFLSRVHRWPCWWKVAWSLYWPFLVQSLGVLQRLLFILFPTFFWVDKLNGIGKASSHAPLTLLVKVAFWIETFNDIKISFVTCAVYPVGQGRLTTMVNVRRTWKKLI